MDADLAPVYDRVMQARRPEDMFKVMTVVLPPRLLEEHLKPEMDKMLAILDKERYSAHDDRDAAEEAREKLETSYETALSQAGQGLYAIDDYQPSPLPRGGKRIVVGGTTYAVGEKFHHGTHSSIYHGRRAIGEGTGAVALRVAHTPGDNPYLFREIQMLDVLHRKDVGYWKNVPFMFSRFAAGERIGVVCRYFEGVTLTEIRDDILHRDGLDQRHVVWVMDRILSLLGYAHKVGIVHGHINPDRIRVRPSNHNAFLSGWGRAVYKPDQTGEKAESLGGVFEAPEVKEGKTVGPWTDIYSLGKTLIWLIGGNENTNEMPDTVEPKVRQFLLNMVHRHPKGRPQNAWQLYEAQNRLKDSLWERQFIHLNLSPRR